MEPCKLAKHHYFFSQLFHQGAIELLPVPQLRELLLDLRMGRNTVGWLKESGDLASPPNSASESLLTLNQVCYISEA